MKTKSIIDNKFYHTVIYIDQDTGCVVYYRKLKETGTEEWRVYQNSNVVFSRNRDRTKINRYCDDFVVTERYSGGKRTESAFIYNNALCQKTKFNVLCQKMGEHLKKVRNRESIK